MVEKIKLKLFRATTEKMFLHGSTTWSLTKAQEKSLDGTYKRMLQMWKTYLGKTGLKKASFIVV